MGKIFEKASDYEVKPGDRLATIASRYSVTWQDIAEFNWAATQPREVLRALCEQVGTASARAMEQGADPSTLLLDPKFGPKKPLLLRIPKVWTPEPVHIQKKYVLKIKQHTPAAAVGIRAVDQWFMPGDQSCDVSYVLDGEPGRADAVDFEVYASNYAELTDWNDGLPKFAPLADTPVYTEKLTGPHVAPQSHPTLSTWKGTTNCGKGALSGKERTINVAFSPYTVLLRYRSSGGDGEKARIDLDPFWPAFTSGGVVRDSCRITWRVQNAPRLAFGLLQIVNGKGEVVFMKGLDDGEIGAGQFDWDGNDSTGTPVSADEMPYRVLIEVHRGVDDPNGLALAAAHTEVRLFVDPRTRLDTVRPYDFSQDKSSLDLSLADVYHKDDELTPDGNGKLWTKFKLAVAGYHPGPVKDASDTDELKAAIREFKRSVPLGNQGNYTRMPIDEIDDGPMKNVLGTLADNRKRPWFGKPADQTDWKPDTEANALKTALRDFTSQMIVWIDDRNWYTDPIYWLQPDWTKRQISGISPATRTFLNNAHANMFGAPRGSLEDRDDRTAADARDIARPWIPFQVDFRILRKNQALTDTSDAVPEETGVTSRQSIGPIRVDWSFDEIEETENIANVGDLPKLDPVIENTLRQLYAVPQSRNRTRIALRWLLNELMEEHDRVDIARRSKYYNAPQQYGGVRPTALNTYFSIPFGIGTKSLYPWTGHECARRETVMCAVHDDVAQSRELLFSKRVGRAGVYFRPSLIAGDGYQVRAQVRFDKDGHYQFPNADALKARYPKLPQTHSAKFRLWRKTSIRGYVCWGPENSWTQATYNPHGTFPDSGPHGFRKYYTACHVHIVNELGEQDNALTFTPTGLFPDLQLYRQMVMDSLAPTDNGPRRQPNNITRTDASVWPWGGHPKLGIERSPVHTAPWDWFPDLANQTIFPLFLNLTMRISLGIVQAIEKQKGWMRGHVIVQHQTSPPVFMVEYECTCGATYVYIQQSDRPLQGEACGLNGCTATLTRRSIFNYVGHYECVCGCRWYKEGDDPANPQGEYDQRPCPRCGGALTISQGNRITYSCTGGHGGLTSSPGQDGLDCPTCGGTLTVNVNVPPQAGPHIVVHRAIPVIGTCGDVPSAGLPATSAGFPAGVSWDVNGDTDLWAHELAHNRYYEHAGGSASRPDGDLNLTHDSVDNLAEWRQAAYHRYRGGDRNFNRTWDRACLMSYITDVTLANPDPDAKSSPEAFNRHRDCPCFCYKCVLKNRGWKLGDSAYPPRPALTAAIPPALPTPPGTLTD